MQKTQKKVLVFGTFDGIHEGHIYFLNQAKKLGDLFISVASDESILKRKLHESQMSEEERIDGVKKLKIAKRVSLGDRQLNRWSEIKKIRPNIIVLGYDQKELKKALIEEKKNIGVEFEIVTINSYKPRKFHSSILKK